MMKKFILLPFVLFMIYLAASSSASGPATSSSAEGTGATNSTGCNTGSCHTSNTSTQVSIALYDATGTTPVTNYVAGTSYIIRLTGTNSSTTSLPRYGFQLTAVKNAGAGAPGATYAGLLATTGLPTSTHNVAIAGIRVVEHTSALLPATGTGGSGTTYVQSIAWTAPATGFGDVRLCGVVNAVDFTGNQLNDRFNKNFAIVPEHVAPITGTLFVCEGANTTLADATTAGTWTSSNNLVATVSGGTVHGVAAGTVTISYDAGLAGIATALVTVQPLPVGGAIVGVAPVCVGGSVTLTNPTGTPGGTWSTTTPTITTINATTGVVTGLSAGSGSLFYTVNTPSCGSAVVSAPALTVNPLPNAGAVSGTDSVCQGSTVSLTATGTSGGTWISTNITVATVTNTGIVSGVSAGNTVIKYAVTTPTCGNDTASRAVRVLAPTPSAGTISGPASVCQGNSISLSSSATGGQWSSFSTSVATVNASTGVVGGASGGLTIISYTITGSCGSNTAVYPITVNTAPVVTVMTGSPSVCIGWPSTFADATTGGTWSVGSSAIATITAVAGSNVTVSGLSAGTTLLSYTVVGVCGATTVTSSINVGAAAAAGSITGPLASCAGIPLAYTTTGGNPGSTVRWSSSNTAIATINTGSGIAGGIAGGTTNIGYATSNSCSYDSTFITLTIQGMADSGTITGANTACVGTPINLTESVTGGVWASSNNSIATVNGSGMVTTLSPGTVTISYGTTNACGTTYARHIITVVSGVSAGTVSGPTAVCVGSSISLNSIIAGGVWTSSAPTVATVTSLGIVSGLTAGPATITYTVTNACGSATATYADTVIALPVAGTISGASSVCVGGTTSLAETELGGVWSTPSTTATVSATGDVTGLSAGVAIISYTVNNVCGSTAAVHPVSVNGPPSSGTISGSPFVCVGANTTLTDGVAGGVWSTSNALLVTVSATGVATGVGIGAATISYSVTGTCGVGVATYTVSSGLSASGGTITGADSVCVSAATLLTDPVVGGVWTSSAPSVAVVNSLGVVSGVSGGTATITYTVTTSCGVGTATHNIYVNTLPSPGVITGTVNVCAGSSVLLGATVSGGIWSSNTPAVATVDGSGNVTGVSNGTFIIVYTVSNTCGSTTALHTMISTTAPLTATISGATRVCQGSNTVLSASVGGGMWSASNNTASVSASGVVTGMTYGIDTLYYTITNSCGTTIASYVDTVYPTSLAGGIMGSNNVCLGDTIQYSIIAPGGVWTLSNNHAVVDSVTGFVIPISAGPDTLTYRLSNVCGTSSASLAFYVYSAAICATGVNNAALHTQGLKVYPNPTDGIFSIDLPARNSDAVVTIVDVFGKVVATRTVSSIQDNVTFDLSALAAGSYIIKVTSGDQTFRDKIVIW